ncbi:MAG: FHA domain-containing protein [Armatimonadetes bacterium]|nr:FHA domain-containing protein [Armatimonadota bacterium]
MILKDLTVIALICTLGIPSAGYAQTRVEPVPPTPSPKGTSSSPRTPPANANAPVAPDTPVASPDTPVASPAAPAGGTPPATPATPPAENRAIVALTLPTTGNYIVMAEDPADPRRVLAPPTSVNGPKAAVELPEAVRTAGTVALSVIQPENQTLAREVVDVKTGAASISFATADFDRVATLPVQVTSDGKAVSTALVELTGPDGESLGQEQLLPGQGGIATFRGVPAGRNTVRVIYNDGQTATQEITVDTATPPAQRMAVVTVAGAAATEPLGASTAPAPGANDLQEPAEAGQNATAQLERNENPAPAPTGASPLQGFIGFLIAVGLLALLGIGAFLYFRTNPEVLNRLIGKLPLPENEPEAVRPSEPPPVQVPAGSCAYCGGAKDPVTGACACSAPAAAAVATAAPASSGTGPRLVGVAGPMAGRTFPLKPEGLTVGREPANDISLEGDSTASRRHARIEGADGAYVVRDEGSSNGTFLNGARVTESPLNPGDELTIGQTRFRFEG